MTPRYLSLFSNVKETLFYAFFLCVSATFLLTIVDYNKARGFFYTGSALGLLSLLLYKRKISKQDWFVFFSLVTFALARFVWLFWQGEPSNPIAANSYSTYWRSAKILLCGGFMVLNAMSLNSVSDWRFRKSWFSAVYYITSLCAVLVIFKSYWIDHLSRAQLGELVSTSAAYLITIVHLLALNHLLANKYKYSDRCFIPVVVAALVLQYYSILLTGTRSAMIFFSLFAFGVFFYYFWASKKYIFTCFVSLFLSVVIGYVNIIHPRIEEFKVDVSSYQKKPDNVTSIGARFSMWTSACYIIQNHPLGTSLLQRRALINQAVDSGRINRQVLSFIDIHLHNDFLEIASLQGLQGGVLLLFMYGAMLRMALKKKRQAKSAFILVTGVTIVCGLSDVMLIWGWFDIFFMAALALVGLSYPDCSEQSQPETA